MTVRDNEVLDLLRDEPELLAMADAVAVTQRAPRRLPRRLLAVPAVAVALLALALVAPWEGSSPSFVDRALAAVGDEPVLHAVVRTEQEVDWHRVDLATGEASAPRLVVEREIWYDPERSLEHILTRTDGKLTDDELRTPEGVTNQEGTVYTCAWIARHPVEATRLRISCKLSGENGTVPKNIPEPPPIIEPALGGFLTGYRDALESGTARRVGEGVVDGRPVYWLALTLTPPRPPGADRDLETIRERVAVDRETYRPLLVRPEHGPPYEVVKIETVAADEGDFSEPERLQGRDLIAGGSVLGEDEISLDAARSLFTVPALWAGQRVAGLEFARATRIALSTRYARETGLPPKESFALALTYGHGDANYFGIYDRRSGGDALTITEATEEPFALGWPSRGPLWSLPPAGFVRIGPFDWGFLRRDGLYVKITSSLGEDAVLAAARALEPIPSG
jgi:hypothetical protein